MQILFEGQERHKKTSPSGKFFCASFSCLSWVGILFAILALAREVGVHGLGDVLGVFDDFDDVGRAEDDVAAGEDAFARRGAVLVDFDEAAIVDLEARRRADNLVFRGLADGDDCAVGRVELWLVFTEQIAFLVEVALVEHRAVFRDGGNALAEIEFDSVGLCVFVLADARADFVAARVDGDEAAALADGRAGGVHCRIARADDRDAVAEVIDVRILQVVDGVMAVAEALATHAEAARTPDAGADEDGVIAVLKQGVERQDAADGRVRADMDAEFDELLLVAVEDLERQAEGRDAIAHHAAKLAFALEDGHVVAELGELDTDRDAGRPRTDDGNVLSLGRFMLHDDLVEVDVGDIVLDARDLDGSTLAALDAVALALLFVVADERADDAHRVIDEEHLARFVDLAVEKEANHLGNVRLSRAAFETAQRLLALEATACLIDDMDGHVRSPVPSLCSPINRGRKYVLLLL